AIAVEPSRPASRHSAAGTPDDLLLAGVATPTGVENSQPLEPARLAGRFLPARPANTLRIGDDLTQTVREPVDRTLAPHRPNRYHRGRFRCALPRRTAVASAARPNRGVVAAAPHAPDARARARGDSRHRS